ncbi:MAG TPA: BtpA/SgcQ family protein [Anaerolineae bacterium]|nr:BtpA/SgcQ family protein [Anaerolineae bacterium]HIQ06751.1 BtpA/SgcQ family protein [Anaerolineae bacterium]
MSASLKELFGVEKPIIAMAHFPALPGAPRYDAQRGLGWIIERVERDVKTLLDGGVDGVLFCNEDDRPYTLQADFETVAVMSRVVAEVAPRNRPFGVDVMWDARAALAIAMATGGGFIRGMLTGTYESDMGLWSADAAALMRYRRAIGAEHVKVFFNITPEFASSLGSRSVALRAKSAAVEGLADGILVSGPMAGAEPDPGALREAKEAIGDLVPVILNTGARVDNIRELLPIADGVIVGSSLKVDGYTWNPVDPNRVKAFMAVVREVREGDG